MVVQYNDEVSYLVGLEYDETDDRSWSCYMSRLEESYKRQWDEDPSTEVDPEVIPEEFSSTYTACVIHKFNEEPTWALDHWDYVWKHGLLKMCDINVTSLPLAHQALFVKSLRALIAKEGHDAWVSRHEPWLSRYGLLSLIGCNEAF